MFKGAYPLGTRYGLQLGGREREVWHHDLLLWGAKGSGVSYV